jgi:hypothetical protein
LVVTGSPKRRVAHKMPAPSGVTRSDAATIRASSPSSLAVTTIEASAVTIWRGGVRSRTN